MLRQNHGWMTTLGLATMLAAATWTLADHLQARVTEVRQDREAQGLTLLEFQRLHDAGHVLVVDVRDRASYEAGRIAGAMHVALGDLERGDPGADEVRRLARGRLVVTYCSCPTEASSLKAARLLVSRGVPSRALIGGYPKWVEAGGRVEHGGHLR